MDILVIDSAMKTVKTFLSVVSFSVLSLLGINHVSATTSTVASPTNYIRFQNDGGPIKYPGQSFNAIFSYVKPNGQVDPATTFTVESSDPKKMTVSLVHSPDSYLLKVPDHAPIGSVGIKITALKYHIVRDVVFVITLPPAPTLKPTATPTPTLTPTPTPTKSPLPNTNPPKLGSCQIYPSDNAWNQDISSLPLSPLSANYVNSIGANAKLHPDFGGASYGQSYGIPFITVTNSQAMIPINFTAYGDESDPGPYPVPLTAPIEGGSSSTGDRHVLVVNTQSCKLYELYRAFPQPNKWNADSGAVFDLKSNALRPKYWTSADAAGLPIMPGLVKYAEVASGSVNHAIRFTVSRSQKAFIAPATHFASSSTDSNLPPMGLRLRLKSSYDISSLPSQAKIIATAMKKYGLIVADNGSNWFFQGDVNNSWDDNQLNTLKTIPGSAFEAVNTGPLIH